MQLQVQLDREYIRPWAKAKNGWVCASCFRDELYLDSAALAQEAEKTRNTQQAKELLSKLNGSFAVILSLEDGVFFAVDRQATVPLFYETQGDVLQVMNRLRLAEIARHGVDEEALSHLKDSLFIRGKKTAARNVFQVQAGQWVTEKDGKLHDGFYHVHGYEERKYPDRAALLEKIDEVFLAVAKRLITVLDGRRAVIPLSGGHDSRLIVYYLKRLGYEKILTYTYGEKGNWESAVSRKAAQFLNVPWYCVEYSPKKLRKLMKEGFAELADYYTNGVSSVCLQEWYAVSTLTQQGILQKGDVIVPGHSFDAFAGSFLLPHYVEHETVRREQLLRDLVRKHHMEGSRPADVEQVIPLLPELPEQMAARYAFDVYQSYNIRERQAKFICAAVRMYTKFGYDWYLPLWDENLIAFWESIPMAMKYNRELFFEFTMTQYPDLMQAAPVENLKSKDLKPCRMDPVSRLLRKIGQLACYTSTHYCLGYFSRGYVYGVFLRRRTLNIGCMVNEKLMKLLMGENK